MKRILAVSFISLAILTATFVDISVLPHVSAAHKQSHTPKVKGNQTNKQTLGTSTTSKQYAFDVLDFELVEESKTNQNLTATITIKNTSNFTWNKQDIKLSYHLVDTNGQYEVYRGDKTSITKSLKPGEQLTQKMNIKAPEIPGKFKVSIDLIDEAKQEWFSKLGDSSYSQSLNIVGEITVYNEEGMVVVNDGQEYTNNSLVKLSFQDLKFQPNSPFAGFIYNYAQSGIQKNTTLNSVDSWGKWQLKTASKWDLGIRDPYAGLIKVFARFRAFKKHTSAPEGYTSGPDSYGSAMYQFGRSSKTTGAWWDEIFFDNIPPEGSITINNGDDSTLSKTVDLQITATDDLLGMKGSGLNGMRLDYNCDGSWNTWESIENKPNITLGGSSVLEACVQFRDKAGNLSTVYKDQIQFYEPFLIPNPNSPYGFSYGYGIGTPDNKFAGLTADKLRKPWIEFDRFIRWDGATKWNEVKHWDMPEPQITFVERLDKTTIEVSGVAIRKYNPVDIIVNNEYRHCWACGSDWEWFKEQRSIEHVKVQILKADGTILKELWNDDSQGRFRTELQLGSNLSESDKIYAKVYTYGKHYFDGLKWWSDTYENNVEFVAWDLWSGNGEKIGIPKYAALLKTQIETSYNLKVVNGDTGWKAQELEWAIEVFNTVPKQLWDNGRVKSINRQSVGAYYPSADCITGGPLKDEIVGCFDSNTSKLWMFDGYQIGSSLEFVSTSPEEEFKITLLHEFLHGYADAHPQKLDQFDNISWVTDATRWKSGVTTCDFIDQYASTANQEEFAENFAIVYVKPDAFQKRLANDPSCKNITWDESSLKLKLNFNLL